MKKLFSNFYKLQKVELIRLDLYKNLFKTVKQDFTNFLTLRTIMQTQKYYNKDLLPNNLSKELNDNELSEGQLELSRLSKDIEKPIINEEDQVEISNLIYKEFLKKGMLGNLTNFIVEIDSKKEVDVGLISTIYSRIKQENLYKTIDSYNPNYILVQFRPDLFFNNIEKKAKLLVNGKISEESFLKDLLRSPSDIYPCYNTLLDLCSKFSNLKIPIAKNIEKNLEVLKKLSPPENKDRVNFEAISTAGIWAENTNEHLSSNVNINSSEKNNNTFVKIMLADIPTNIQIHKLVNSLTLLEIKQMFSEIFKAFPKNPDFEPQTSLTTAQHLYPEIFLKDSDRFISKCFKYLFHLLNSSSKSIQESNTTNDSIKYNSTIDYIIKASDNNKIGEKTSIVGILGYGQSLSIPLYLENDKNTIKEILNVGKRYSSLIYGYDSLEIVCDKLSLLYLIFFGPAKIIPKNYYLNLIDEFVDEEIVMTGYNKKEELTQKMVYLFETLLKENRDLSLKLISEGLKEKEIEFMKKVF